MTNALQPTGSEFYLWFMRQLHKKSGDLLVATFLSKLQTKFDKRDYLCSYINIDSLYVLCKALFWQIITYTL